MEGKWGVSNMITIEGCFTKWSSTPPQEANHFTLDLFYPHTVDLWTAPQGDHRSLMLYVNTGVSVCHATILYCWYAFYRPIQMQVFLLYTPQTVILSASTAVRSRNVQRRTDSVEGFCHLPPFLTLGEWEFCSLRCRLVLKIHLDSPHTLEQDCLCNISVTVISLPRGWSFYTLGVHVNGRKVRCRQYDKCSLLRVVSLNGVPLHQYCKTTPQGGI